MWRGWTIWNRNTKVFIFPFLLELGSFGMQAPFLTLKKSKPTIFISDDPRQRRMLYKDLKLWE